MTIAHDRSAAVDWRSRLHAVGLRVTPGRLAVLGWLQWHPHVSVAEVFAGIAPDLPSLSVQSVHNIVGDLTAAGLIRRVDLPDSEAARYEMRIGDNHHHIQCIVCGRVEDVDCLVGHAPCLTPSDAHRMRVLEADVTFRGVCLECEGELGGRNSPPAWTGPKATSSEIISPSV